MLDIAFIIQSEPTYKCTYCGSIIGSCSLDGHYDPPEWKDWNYCPHCGAPLYNDEMR